MINYFVTKTCLPDGGLEGQSKLIYDALPLGNLS